MDACSYFIPNASQYENKCRAAWNEYVYEHEQRALLWHNMWRDSGFSKHGVVADKVKKLGLGIIIPYVIYRTKQGSYIHVDRQNG